MDESHTISLKSPKEPPRIPPPIVPEKKRSQPWRLATLILFVIVFVAGVVYFSVIKKPTDDTAKTVSSASTDVTDDSSQKEAGQLVAEVGKIIQLPQEEVPTIATVSDPAKLQDQSFFKNAKVGDRVLIYVQAKKAYLYRPSTHLLIEVAPITPQAQ